MNRSIPYFGLIMLVFLGIFTVISPVGRATLPIHKIITSATSTMSSVSSESPAPSLEPKANVASITPTSTSVVPKKNMNPSTLVAILPVQPKLTPTPPSASLNASLDASASALRGALVNIICYVPKGSGLHSISGSGVVIDSKGVILTNAHIGQYFLLADRQVSCTIRSGSPAVDKYSAALIYISPAWLHANAAVLTEATPTGTGEYDFALLAITKSATNVPLPASFPFIALAKEPPLSNTAIVIASYGAQFLESSQIQSSLFPTIVFGSVKDVFTFVKNTIDVLALGGSVAAQEGSSGGGVADASGTLVGTITTSTIEGDTNTRSLSAITASYIRAEYASETGTALDLLLSEPTSTSVADFASQILALESILTAQL